jgi:cyclic beta-1,2-glucan synthetase
VLDPIVSLRRVVELDQGGEAELVLVLGAAASREEAVALAARFAARGAADEALAGAKRREKELLRAHGCDAADAAAMQNLAARAVYGATSAEIDSALLGDREALERAKAYLRAQGVDVELPSRVPDANPPPTSRDGARASQAQLAVPIAAAARRRRGSAEPRHDTRAHLAFDNGYGGFAADGSEYVIRVAPLAAPSPALPPLPWINVVANESFGFLVSETGASCTWSRNSRENRLTPWYNDPLADPHGEALYVRDDDAGVFWSPLPGPAPGDGSYEARHGFGYSLWRHASVGLRQETWMLVPCDEPVKLIRLRLTNRGRRERRLSLFAYFRLVLGTLPHPAARIDTSFDSGSGAILARNLRSADFADGVTFAAAVAPPGADPVEITCDRTAFVGRNGHLAGCARSPGQLLMAVVES